jgi:hypothetical protein
MLKRFWLSLLAWLGLTAQPDFVGELVKVNPANEEVPPNRLVVVGGRGYQKWAYLRCPCGCDEVIMLSLAKSRRPRWTVTFDRLNRPSIEPSIRQTSGCHSHFWVRRGVVDWCGDTGRTPG